MILFEHSGELEYPLSGNLMMGLHKKLASLGISIRIDANKRELYKYRRYYISSLAPNKTRKGMNTYRLTKKQRDLLMAELSVIYALGYKFVDMENGRDTKEVDLTTLYKVIGERV
jgi:hypothetical protein